VPDRYEFVPNRTADYLNVFDPGAGIVVKRIQVGRRPDVTATTIDGRYLYVAGEYLAVVDLETLEVIRTLTGQGIEEHYGLNVFPDGRRMFLYNYDGSIAILDHVDDPRRLTVEEVLRVNEPAEPEAAVGGKGHFTGDGAHYINANWHTNSVFSIDLAKRYTVTTLVPSGFDKPDDLVMTADHRKGYAASFGTDEHPGSFVHVFDAAEGRVVKAIRVGRRPAGLTMSPDNRTVYVTNVQDGSVSGIDTASDDVLYTVSAAASYRAAGIPGDWLDIEGVSVSADGRTLYAYAVNYGALVVIRDLGGTNEARLIPEGS
jgi:YVTN family beta-propeller protein